MKRKKIVCCGEMPVDFISKMKTRGQMQFCATPGGCIFNTAVLSSKLGLEVAMVTRIGKDRLADFVIDYARSQGIDTRGIVQTEDTKTPLAIACIDKKGDASYSFYKMIGPQLAIPDKDIPKRLFDGASIFHCGSAYSYNDYSHQTLMKLLNIAREKKLFISYDPNARKKMVVGSKAARARMLNILPFVSLAKMNDFDLKFITAQKTLDKALRKIKDLTDAHIVITLGAKGAFYLRGKKRIFVPAFKVKVADTIGAGDSFTAGLLYRYACYGEKIFHEDTRTHLRFATAVSAITCTKDGATSAIRGLKQVKTFLKRNR
ncbi:MAG: carbohydrate kinase [Candidatus Omnitrophica bacterium]|nr:carbohydrate kinase [Candidatus Omnitrophota bacterium]